MNAEFHNILKFKFCLKIKASLTFWAKWFLSICRTKSHNLPILCLLNVKSSKTKILGFRSRDPSICDVLQQIYRISKSDSISLIMTRINGILKMFFFINIPICKIQYSIKLKGKPGETIRQKKRLFLKQAVGLRFFRRFHQKFGFNDICIWGRCYLSS